MIRGDKGMRRIVVCFGLIFLGLPYMLLAEELFFPKTENEIVEALSKAETKTITAPNGIKYVADEGSVYKIINGRRFRLRGIQVVEALEILPKVGALINFDFDSAEIRSDSFSLLDEFGKAIKSRLPDATIMIAGHTDSVGSNGYNQKLSKQRADAVVEYLYKVHGIGSDRLLSEGFGEEKPIKNNDTEANRAKNRRVEFVRIQ